MPLLRAVHCIRDKRNEQTCNLITNFTCEQNRNVVLFNTIINNYLNFKSSVECECSEMNIINKQFHKRVFRSVDNTPVQGQSVSAVHLGTASC